MPSRPIRVRTLIPYGVVLLLPVLLLWRVVFLHEVFLPGDLLKDVAPWKNPGGPSVPWNALLWDGIAQFYPWREFAAVTERQGYLPFWNPHEFCGAPFAANSQSAIYYPLNVLFLLFPIKQAFGISVLVHLFLTGAFLYTFLRRAHRLQIGSALVGAVTWQMCSWQVSWLALPTFTCVATWMPAALLMVDAVAKRPRALSAAGLGAALGMMILAGHLQICFYGFLLIAGYAVFRILPDIRSCGQRAFALGSVAAAAAGIALLLGMAQVLPAIELSHASSRLGGRPTWQSYEGYLGLKLPFYHLATLVIPGFYGNPSDGTYWSNPAYSENACYMGVFGLLLAVFGTISGWRRNREVRFFAVTAIVAMLLALGTLLNAIFYFGVPGFSATGSPGRVLVIWSLCAAILSAAGTERLLARVTDSIKPAFTVATAAIALLVASTVASAWWVLESSGQHGALVANLATEQNPFRVPIVVLLAGGIAIWRFRSGHLSTRTFSAMLVAVVAADLLATGIGFNYASRPADIYPDTAITRYLRAHEGLDRVMPINKSWSMIAQRPPECVFPPNAAMVYGLYDTQGYDSLFPGQYMWFITRVNNDGRSPAPNENGNMVFTRGFASDAAQVLAPRYVMALDGGPLAAIPAPPLIPLMHDAGVTLYENPEARPRFEIAETGRPLAAWETTPTRLHILVPVAPGQGVTVIVRDQWYPGWHAFVDGRETHIYESPYICRLMHWTAPKISSGMARLDLRFLPSTSYFGIYCLCLGWSCVLGMCSYALVRPTRRE